ncbi:MAG: hypothetical protein AAF790_11845, partial [Planctomycetota bacterium]
MPRLSRGDWRSVGRRLRLQAQRLAAGCHTAGLALTACLVAAFAALGQPPQPDAAEIDRHELFFGAHLPTDRAVSRALDLAQDLAEQGRYSEAVKLVLQALELEKDGFGATRQDAGAPLESLKRRARSVLASLPPAGRRAYELEVDSPSLREAADA